MEDLELFRDENFDDKHIPTKWDYFEAMDRSSIAFAQLEGLLYNHPGLDKEQSEMAAKAFGLLFEIYQRAGSRFFELTKDEDDKDSSQR
jgi:hypothetical protein